MTSSDPLLQRSFQLSPSAGIAAGLMRDRLLKMLYAFAERAENCSYAAPDDQVRRFPDRLNLAFSYIEQQLSGVFDWLFASRETSNFTYHLHETNIEYLACFVGTVASIGREQAKGYIRELQNDTELKEHVLRVASSATHYIDIDKNFDFGRRLGWYAIARAMKPKLIVETGVEQGLGSLILTAALKRNAAEGSPGIYRGTDINPKAGYLFQGSSREFGEILYGDSIQSLQGLDQKIDLFINDSDHSADYEAREYDTVASKLSDRAIVLGDNAHVTDRLYRFASATGRKFLFFQEKPLNHWYPGAGIGAAYGREV
jgi:hypothetical protein